MGALTRSLIVAGLVLAAPLSAAEPKTQPKFFGDAARGRELAARWCVSCHKVNGAPLNDQVPTFASLATSARSEDAIRGFLLQPHRPMPPLSLSNQEIEDLVSYLRSLKSPAP